MEDLLRTTYLLELQYRAKQAHCAECEGTGQIQVSQQAVYCIMCRPHCRSSATLH